MISQYFFLTTLTKFVTKFIILKTKEQHVSQLYNYRK